jgi:hypothetical protein
MHYFGINYIRSQKKLTTSKPVFINDVKDPYHKKYFGHTPLQVSSGENEYSYEKKEHESKN